MSNPMTQLNAASGPPHAPPPFFNPDDMPDVYALTAVGTCMMPLLEDQACLAFDKRKKPVAGDLVSLIFTRDAAQRRRMPGWIKRLVVDLPPFGLAAGATVVVEQINPPREYWIPADDILAVHKFIGTAISQGDGTANISRKLLEAA